MIELHLTRGDNYERVYLRHPDTPAEVGEVYAMPDSISSYAGEPYILDVKSPVKNLAQFIKNADLAKQEDLEKLNRLDEKIRSMSVNEKALFSGTSWADSINCLDNVFRVADRLKDYWIIPKFTCDRELGGYVLNTASSWTSRKKCCLIWTMSVLARNITLTMEGLIPLMAA